jgi:hypothetical protein
MAIAYRADIQKNKNRLVFENLGRGYLASNNLTEDTIIRAH